MADGPMCTELSSTPASSELLDSLPRGAGFTNFTKHSSKRLTQKFPIQPTHVLLLNTIDVHEIALVVHLKDSKSNKKRKTKKNEFVAWVAGQSMWKLWRIVQPPDCQHKLICSERFQPEQHQHTTKSDKNIQTSCKDGRNMQKHVSTLSAYCAAIAANVAKTCSNRPKQEVVRNVWQRLQPNLTRTSDEQAQFLDHTWIILNKCKLIDISWIRCLRKSRE